MEKLIKKTSFEESDKADIEYWKQKSPEEKLDVLQYLREEYHI